MAFIKYFLVKITEANDTINDDMKDEATSK